MHGATIKIRTHYLVMALRYQLGGRGFDSPWCHWKFFIGIILPAYKYYEYFLWCKGLTNLPLSCVDCLEIWDPVSWFPQGLFRAVPGLLYFHDFCLELLLVFWALSTIYYLENETKLQKPYFSIYRDVTRCRLSVIYRRFGATYLSHHQGPYIHLTTSSCRVSHTWVTNYVIWTEDIIAYFTRYHVTSPDWLTKSTKYQLQESQVSRPDPKK